MNIDLGYYKIIIKGLIDLNENPDKLPVKNCLFYIGFENTNGMMPYEECMRIMYYTPMVDCVPGGGESISYEDMKEIKVSLKDDFKKGLNDFLCKYAKKKIKETIKEFK